MKKFKKYIWNLLIAFDQFVNTVFGGDPDETISSRVGKHKDTSRLARFLAGFLDLFEWNHAEKSIEKDEGKDEIL